MKRISALLTGLLTVSLQADWTEHVTINGYVSVEYEQRVNGDKHPRVDEHGSFDSDMFDLVLNVQPTDRLRIAADLTWEHGAQSELGKGNVGVEYAFAEYTLSDAFKIRAGKMFTPFGIYNEIHTAKPSTIIFKEPNPTNKIYFISSDKYEQTLLYPRWGSGVALLGNVNAGSIPMDYIVQVTNGDLVYGAGGNEYDKDDNDRKAVTARVRADLSDNLQIGVSYYRDEMVRYERFGVEKTTYTQEGEKLTFVTREYLPVGKMKVDSQGVFMIWHLSEDARLELEGVRGTLDVEDVDSFARMGYSAVASYYVLPRVNLYFLYAWADPNDGKEHDTVVNFAPGVNIEIDDNMFLKTDYFNVRSEQDNVLYKGADYGEFRIGLAIGF